MSRTLKWILGIVLVLFLCAGVGGAGFFLLRRSGASVLGGIQSPAPNVSGTWRMPMHPGFTGPRSFSGERELSPGLYPRMRMRGPYGFSPFGMGLMMVGGLFRLPIPLGLMALVGVVGYLLGRNSARRSVPFAAAGPPQETAQSASPTPPDEPAATTTEEPGQPS